MDSMKRLYTAARDNAYVWELVQEIDAALDLSAGYSPLRDRRREIEQYMRCDELLTTICTRQWRHTICTLLGHSGYVTPTRNVLVSALEGERDLVVNARNYLVDPAVNGALAEVLSTAKGCMAPEQAQESRVLLVELLTDTSIIWE